MPKSSSVAAILASALILSVVLLVSCEKSENGCDKLDKHLRKHLPNELDAAKNYEVALKISALSFAKTKVVKSWKLVHEAVQNQSCSDSSIKAWLSFGKCVYDQGRLSVVLKPELMQFSEVCEKDILRFLPEEQKKYESQLYSSVRKPLFQFLSDSFIAHYLDANPGEPPVHLGRSESGQECCMPDKAAISSATVSLQSIVQEGVAQKTSSVELRNKAKVSELLDGYLYLPCETYQQLMYHHFYRELIQASKKFAPKLLRMLIDDDRSSAFKLGVFRYQFCSRLQNMESRRRFTYAVIGGLQ